MTVHFANQESPGAVREAPRFETVLKVVSRRPDGRSVDVNDVQWGLAEDSDVTYLGRVV